jgi:enoyl-CoA hydratase/carnithine racemase
MDILQWKKTDSVVTLTMTKAENRQNLQFAQSMLTALEQIEGDCEVTALIITSSDAKNFSQGVDVEWLMLCMAEQDHQAIKDFMYAMNDVFWRLLTYPIPVIAAINGHAYGNGAMLAGACDFRFMRRDKGFFCLPEVNVGIPLMPGMIAWMRKAIPEPLFNRMALTGERQTADTLAQAGVIERACADLDDLQSTTMAFAQTLCKKRGIFGELKRRMHVHIAEAIKLDHELIESLQLMISD